MACAKKSKWYYIQKSKKSKTKKGNQKTTKRKISKKAVMASLKSSKTPKHLKEGLRKYAKKRGFI